MITLRATALSLGALAACSTGVFGQVALQVELQAVGSEFPTPVVVNSSDATLVNGDFTLRPTPGDLGFITIRTLGDATEEITTWEYVLGAQPGAGAIAACPDCPLSISSASLSIKARSGGDSPSNDKLTLNGGLPGQPFGGTPQFSSIDQSVDLLDLFGEDAVRDAIRSGRLSFSNANDILFFDVTLSIQGTVDVTPCGIADLTTSGATIAGTTNYLVPDGVVDLDDLGIYLLQWLDGAVRADLTSSEATLPGQPGYGVPDGVTDLGDLGFFLVAWLDGCS
ncbi:MAG: GC-type dockerin domain-anchored protein [Planctomycetota bacterium]